MLLLLWWRPPTALPWRSLVELPIALLLGRALMRRKRRLTRRASKLRLPLLRVALLGMPLRGLLGSGSRLWWWRRLTMQVMHGPMVGLVSLLLGRPLPVLLGGSLRGRGAALG